METLGKHGEQLTAEEYTRLGYTIIDRNVRLHQNRQVGEIDIIVRKEKELVFIEVKTRRSKRFGEPAEAVNFFKQRKLVRAAKLYLLQRPQYDHYDWRFDVAEVNIDNTAKPVKILMNVIEDIS